MKNFFDIKTWSMHFYSEEIINKMMNLFRITDMFYWCEFERVIVSLGYANEQGKVQAK
jgi:hypothetical protein